MPINTITKLIRISDQKINRFKRFIWRYYDIRHQTNIISLGVKLNQTTLAGHVRIGERVQLAGDIHIGKYSTIGSDSILRGEISIGNYSQLADKVGVYAVNHGQKYLSIYNNKALLNGKLKQLREISQVVIGSDVWIGHGAIILPSVKIGNGAIIGAGSVITKDVTPFSVVVGNPSKVLRMRVSAEIIDLLQAWQWWELEPSDLAQYEDLFMSDFSQASPQLIAHLKELVDKQ